VAALLAIVSAIFQLRGWWRRRKENLPAAPQQGIRPKTGFTAYQKKSRIYYAVCILVAAGMFLIMWRGSPDTQRIFNASMRWFFIGMMILLAVLFVLLGLLLFLHRDPVVKQAATLALADRHDEAIDLLRAHIKAKGETALRLNALGLLLMDRQRLEEALEQFRAAEKLGGQVNTAINNQAIALHKMDRLDEAIVLMKKVCAAAPLDALAACNMCHFLADAGREIEARDELERAEQILDRYDARQIPELWRSAIDECRNRLPTARGFPVIQNPPT
jgi:tetratricopeptide (TPR) repeat protein